MFFAINSLKEMPFHLIFLYLLSFDSILNLAWKFRVRIANSMLTAKKSGFAQLEEVFQNLSGLLRFALVQVCPCLVQKLYGKLF